jgi:hypothetical protein
MPRASAIIVKPREGKATGLAVLVPQDAAACASPACDAAEFYKAPDGTPLLKRTMNRRVMEETLRTAERLHHDGDKHPDVKSGKIADARKEAKRLLSHMNQSFTVAEVSALGSGSVAQVTNTWSNEDARISAEAPHKALADAALAGYIKSMDVNADELLRIASLTKHPSVAEDAVKAAVKEGASKSALLLACDRIQHEKASVAAYESAKSASK